MYLLDTDHLSLIQRGGIQGQGILLRLTETTIPFATTVITYEEQTRGWLDRLSRAKTVNEQVSAYQRLQQHTVHYRDINIFTFDIVAAQEYEHLRKAYPRLGKMDLRIAAIALTQGATVLTRNYKDFGQITTLKTEDWSIPRSRSL
jgi:tRNA(fMet)-specific endonuclease VapC